jgi:hypothetical protein
VAAMSIIYAIGIATVSYFLGVFHKIEAFIRFGLLPIIAYMAIIGTVFERLEGIEAKFDDVSMFMAFLLLTFFSLLIIPHMYGVINEPWGDKLYRVINNSAIVLTLIGVSLIAPRQAMNKRLIFILCGLMLLLALNEVAKLEIVLSPPKASS